MSPDHPGPPDEALARIEQLLLRRLRAFCGVSDPFSSSCSSSSKPTSQTLFDIHAEALVMSAVHAHLSCGTVCTQRDVYYRLVRHFKSQATVNAQIDRLGSSLCLRRHEMLIVAGSRGLIGGSVAIDGCDLAMMESGAPIGGRIAERRPTGSQGGATCAPAIATCARHILIIEKEAIFFRLLQEGLHHRLPCILITGRGFPDVATRALARYVADHVDGALVVGLADANPAGVHILLQFMAGADGATGRKARDAAQPIPQLRWLGMHTHHVANISMASAGKPFTPRDVRMLRNLIAAAPHRCPQWAGELRAMAQSQRKFEIEDMCAHWGAGEPLSDLLIDLILSHQFI